MKLSLTAADQQFVDELVRTGQFDNPDDVIASALRLMRTLPAWTNDALRREIAIGVDQLDRGESGPWDADATKAELRRRMNHGAGDQKAG